MIRIILAGITLLLVSFSVHAYDCDRTSDFSNLSPSDFCDDDLVNKIFPKFETFKIKKIEAFQPKFPSVIPGRYDSNLLGDKEPKDVWIKAINTTYKRDGVNFSGHYLLVQRGFNGDIHTALLIDLLTGRIIDAEMLVSVVDDIHYISEKGIKKLGLMSDSAFSYRKDSNLLIVKGAFGEGAKKHGIYYFKLENNQLKLVKKLEKPLPDYSDIK